MQKIGAGISRWVGAGLRYFWLFTIIVCETRPYILNAKNRRGNFLFDGGRIESLLVIYNYCL